VRFFNGFRVGTVMGIPILVNPSWFLILALVVFVLGNHFSSEFPIWERWEAWAAALVTSILFFGSVLAHELCHSVVAVRKGIPVRSITLFMLGGVSQISREATRPATEMLIALAGPLCSLVLGAAFLGLGVLLSQVNDGIPSVLQQLGITNLSLGAFNLAPAFPLDGGRVLRAGLWGLTHSHSRATFVAGRLSQGLAGAMMAGGLAVAVWVSPFSGMWIAMIGWFVFTSATASVRQERVDEAMRTLAARDIMIPPPLPLPSGATAADAAARFVMPPSAPCLVIEQGSGELGIITLAALRGLARDRWPATPAASFAIPLSHVRTAALGDPASRAAELVRGAPGDLVLVLDDGQILGAITEETIGQRLRAMRSLGLIRR